MNTVTETYPTAATATAVQNARARKAALLVAGFLSGFLVLNTYWAFGGDWAVAWVLGCDCTVPLAAVWAQEAAIVAGVGVVLGRAGIWQPALPAWIFTLGTWAMAVTFVAVGVLNLFGDNTPQARLLFAPMALVLGALCVTVARGRRVGGDGT